jgi:hypothetical protein
MGVLVVLVTDGVAPADLLKQQSMAGWATSCRPGRRTAGGCGAGQGGGEGGHIEPWHPGWGCLEF